MKYPKYESAKVCKSYVKKFCTHLKKELYKKCIPFEITGCVTTASRYVHFICMKYKDLHVRISDHKSYKASCNCDNTYNVIVPTEPDNEWIDNEINRIFNWLDSMEVN